MLLGVSKRGNRQLGRLFIHDVRSASMRMKRDRGSVFGMPHFYRRQTPHVSARLFRAASSGST